MPHILKEFFEADILEEEVILEWAKKVCFVCVCVSVCVFVCFEGGHPRVGQEGLFSLRLWSF